MPVATFDTFKYAKQLKQAGVPDAQVEAQVAALTEASQSFFQEVATSHELTAVKQELKQDIAAVRQELKQDIAAVRQELKQDIAAVRQELKEDIAAVKQDIAGVKHEIDQSRQEWKHESALIRQEIKQLETNMSADHRLFKWMFGVTSTGTIGILIRLVFFRGL